MQWILDPDIKAPFWYITRVIDVGPNVIILQIEKMMKVSFKWEEWLQYAISIFERNINYRPGLTQNITCLFLDGSQESVWDIQGKVLLSEIKSNNIIIAPWGQIFCLFLPSLFTAK